MDESTQILEQLRCFVLAVRGLRPAYESFRATYLLDDKHRIHGSRQFATALELVYRSLTGLVVFYDTVYEPSAVDTGGLLSTFDVLQNTPSDDTETKQTTLLMDQQDQLIRQLENRADPLDEWLESPEGKNEFKRQWAILNEAQEQIEGPAVSPMESVTKYAENHGFTAKEHDCYKVRFSASWRAKNPGLWEPTGKTGRTDVKFIYRLDALDAILAQKRE